VKVIQAIIFCSIALCIIFLICGYGIRYNSSQSLPQKLYLAVPAISPKIGQIVTFCLPASQVTFAKLMMGLPGDFIEVKNQKIYINGSEKGAIVDAFTPIESGIIPDGFCFVLGMHPESFDSRYAEFGLVPQDSIKEQLWPIF